MTLAIIEDGAIVIRIPVKSIPQVIEGAWAAGGIDIRYSITNLEKFAQDLVHELNHEKEDGTNCIHEMLDGAIENAIEAGADGIDEHPNQEDD